MPLIKFYIFFILNISSIITSSQICNYYSDCSCSFCGEGSANYANCDFINIFCGNGNNILSDKFTHYKNRYLDTFKIERNVESFCGQQKPTIKEDQNENVIIKTGNSYAKNIKIHCYYNVIYTDYYTKYNPLMTYEISESGYNKNKIKFI